MRRPRRRRRKQKERGNADRDKERTPLRYGFHAGVPHFFDGALQGKEPLNRIQQLRPPLRRLSERADYHLADDSLFI